MNCSISLSARWLACLAASMFALGALADAPFEDNMAQRMLACSACHGPQGRAGPDGYYPRLAGKPAGYLYNQLLNFRDGRRAYRPMAHLLAPLSDAYLREMARYFSQLDLPYPSPAPARAGPAALQRARQIVTLGDSALKLPACARCHGAALTGVLPAVPGLLGLPRDYLVSQMGAWRSGQRRAQAPDCMAEIARRLADSDVALVADWLSAQPLPPRTGPAPASPEPMPLACGTALPPAGTQP